ncbi:MAG: hypothetical protein LBC13_02870 [Clostridiales bacterium]|jgi:DNA-directed RNA polymerase subunit RPC12/RpoP|nr:hypothetical protein [Clostridiales bacterium]
MSNVDIVKCETCGADLVFDPVKGVLECPYCRNNVQIAAETAFDRDYFAYENFGGTESFGIDFKCPNCNADVVFEKESAGPCPFCGATCVLDKSALPGIKPDSLLPFAVDKTGAADSGKKWIKKKWFAPSAAKKAFTVDNINGVYAPCFSFTADTFSSYEGRLGEHYTVVVGSGKNRHTETRTRWFKVSGVYSALLRDIVIESSSHLDQKQMDKIGPFDVPNAVSFKKEFLAGFSAERHNETIKECFGAARQKMSDVIRKDILKKYRYDVIDYLNVNTTYKTVRFRHILMPLWVCAYKFKQKVYNFFVNGRTGKSAGKYPLSPARVASAVIVGLAVVMGILYLVYNLAMN